MKWMVVLVAMLALVVFASGVMAQQKPVIERPAAAPTPAPKTAAPVTELEKFTGAIERIDQMAKTIEVKGKVKKEEKTLTITTDDKTKITRAKNDIPFTDLKQGMKVSIQYKKDGGKMVAVALKIAAPKVPAKPKEEPEK